MAHDAHAREEADSDALHDAPSVCFRVQDEIDGRVWRYEEGMIDIRLPGNAHGARPIHHNRLDD